MNEMNEMNETSEIINYCEKDSSLYSERNDVLSFSFETVNQRELTPSILTTVRDTPSERKELSNSFLLEEEEKSLSLSSSDTFLSAHSNSLHESEDEPTNGNDKEKDIDDGLEYQRRERFFKIEIQSKKENKSKPLSLTDSIDSSSESDDEEEKERKKQDQSDSDGEIQWALRVSGHAKFRKEMKHKQEEIQEKDPEEWEYINASLEDRYNMIETDSEESAEKIIKKYVCNCKNTRIEPFFSTKYQSIRRDFHYESFLVPFHHIPDVRKDFLKLFSVIVSKCAIAFIDKEDSIPHFLREKDENDKSCQIVQDALGKSNAEYCILFTKLKPVVQLDKVVKCSTTVQVFSRRNLSCENYGVNGRMSSVWFHIEEFSKLDNGKLIPYFASICHEGKNFREIKRESIGFVKKEDFKNLDPKTVGSEWSSIPGKIYSRKNMKNFECTSSCSESEKDEKEKVEEEKDEKAEENEGKEDGENPYSSENFFDISLAVKRLNDGIRLARKQGYICYNKIDWILPEIYIPKLAHVESGFYPEILQNVKMESTCDSIFVRKESRILYELKYLAENTFASAPIISPNANEILKEHFPIMFESVIHPHYEKKMHLLWLDNVDEYKQEKAKENIKKRGYLFPSAPLETTVATPEGFHTTWKRISPNGSIETIEKCWKQLAFSEKKEKEIVLHSAPTAECPLPMGMGIELPNTTPKSDEPPVTFTLSSTSPSSSSNEKTKVSIDSDGFISTGLRNRNDTKAMQLKEKKYSIIGYKSGYLPDSDKHCIIILGIPKESTVVTPNSKETKLRTNRAMCIAIIPYMAVTNVKSVRKDLISEMKKDLYVAPTVNSMEMTKYDKTTLPKEPEKKASWFSKAASFITGEDLVNDTDSNNNNNNNSNNSNSGKKEKDETPLPRNETWDTIEENTIEYDLKNSFTKATSIIDYTFMYQIGEYVSVEDFDSDPKVECTRGIHFFLTQGEAIEFGFGCAFSITKDIIVGYEKVDSIE